MSSIMNLLITLPDECRLEAIEETTKARPLAQLHEEYSNLIDVSNALSIAFIWGKSRRGSDYWKALYDKLRIEEDSLKPISE